MQTKISSLKQHVVQNSSNTQFLHHKWFVEWHLEIVDRIAAELCDIYTEADRGLVELMVWLHDYGKILGLEGQLVISSEVRRILSELEFPYEVINRVVEYIEVIDKKLEIDLRQAPIEVQIVSTADGCSHMVGPFLSIFWNEATDSTFAGKEFRELMSLNLAKIEKDWMHKVVLPEARDAFKCRYEFLREQAGELPINFLQRIG